jgi:hypothetical protein
MNSIDFNAPLEIVRKFLTNPDIVLRLNPSWYVRDIRDSGENHYSIILYDDRTEKNNNINLTVELYERTVDYLFDTSFAEFSIDEINPGITRVTVKGDFFREDDVPFWLKALRNYFVLAGKKSMFIRLLIDKVWLRMTPSQRRISIIIIIAEGLGLIALATVVVAIKLIR